VRPAKPALLIAYDFETTRIPKAARRDDDAVLIGPATPRPLYLTAYGADFSFEAAIRDMPHLTRLLRARFLTKENEGAKFVGWNANRFDAYIVAAALVREPDLRLVPYLTNNKTVRGLRVELVSIDGLDIPEKERPSWEFLDGVAMLGLVGLSLAKLLQTFAPDHAKLVGVIDFEREEFDPGNVLHCAYAMRDSVGLYHAMTRAQAILLEHFNEPLRVTMGGSCIRILQAHMPEGVRVLSPDPELERILRQQVVRGGFCYCARQHDGPVWKYDINQAYAAAMREAQLPAGSVVPMTGNPHKLPGAFIVCITAQNPTNTVPFYYRTEEGGRLRSAFGLQRIAQTWITSAEFHQLRAEGWAIQCHGVRAWTDSFNLRDYVDRLEKLRTTCEGGPSGPIGTMTKAVGNHSYGKTLEVVAPIEYVIAAECPPDYVPLFDEGFGATPIEHIYYRFDHDRKPKPYHQPQIGGFITAHVRMVLRRAILLAPDAWLYADTDCLVFDRDMTAQLDIDPARYGAWKVEESGTRYRIIAKKVYAQVGGEKPKVSAKGLNVKRLSPEDFARWLDGEPPEQSQVQLNNFLAVLCGAPMYRAQLRTGTATEPRKAAQAV
jgi:hypothetical protein